MILSALTSTDHSCKDVYCACPHVTLMDSMFICLLISHLDFFPPAGYYVYPALSRIREKVSSACLEIHSDPQCFELHIRFSIYLFRAAVKKQPRERETSWVGACGGRGIFTEEFNWAFVLLTFPVLLPFLSKRLPDFKTVKHWLFYNIAS